MTEQDVDRLAKLPNRRMTGLLLPSVCGQVVKAALASAAALLASQVCLAQHDSARTLIDSAKKDQDRIISFEVPDARSQLYLVAWSSGRFVRTEGPFRFRQKKLSIRVPSASEDWGLEIVGADGAGVRRQEIIDLVVQMSAASVPALAIAPEHPLDVEILSAIGRVPTIKHLAVSAGGLYPLRKSETESPNAALEDLNPINLSTLVISSAAAGGARRLLQVVQAAKGLRALVVDAEELDDQLVFQIIKLHPFIETIGLLSGGGARCVISDAGIGAINNLGQVQRVYLEGLPNITHAGLAVVFEKSPLRAIDVRRCPRVGNGFLVSASKLADLSSVYIEDMPAVTDTAIGEFVNTARSRLELGAVGMYWRSQTAALDLGKANVSSLCLSRSIGLPAGLSSSLSTLERLDVLQLSSTPEVNDDFLSGLKHLHIGILDVSYCPITSRGAAVAFQIDGLRTLDLSGCDKIAVGDLQSIRNSTIERLILANNAQFDGRILELASRCSSLRYCDLTNCINVPVASVKSFEASHPEVVVVR